MRAIGGALVLIGAGMAAVPGVVDPLVLAAASVLGPPAADQDLLVGILGGSVAGLGAAIWARAGASDGPTRWNPMAIWCVVNVVLAFGMVTLIDTWVFAPWTARVDAPQAWLNLWFLFIGSAIGLHFALVTDLARKGQHTAVLATVAVWFVIDSTRTVLDGAWFNLFMPNLPCLLTTAALWWLQKRSR